MQPKFRTPEQVYQLWIAALRGGEYQQTFGRLRVNNKFDCLGVLCDLAINDGGNHKWVSSFDNSATKVFMIDNNRYEVYLPRVIKEYLGLSDEQIETLVQLNDVKIYSFKQIAHHIERNVMPKALAAIKQGELI